MYTVMDIESTGLDPWRNEIITMGLVKLDKGLDEVNRAYLKRRPRNLDYWDREAEHIHGISMHEAAGFPDGRKFFNDVVDFIGGDISTLVFHAANIYHYFDYALLNSYFHLVNQQYYFYKVFPEIRSTIHSRPSYAKKAYGVDNQKLDTYAKKINFKLDHHNSMSDALCCAEILKYQIKQDEIYASDDVLIM